jgi:ATP-binding cassette subfamily B multidrug efflux pump
VLGVGGWLVLGDALTAGTLVAFLLYVDRFFDPIRELAQRYNSFQVTMASCERIFGLLDTPSRPCRMRPDAHRTASGCGARSISRMFRSVQAGGASAQGDHVTLRAAPGQRIALVGETGAGKSTVIRLLARFFDVTGGAVLHGWSSTCARSQLRACAASWGSCCRTPTSSQLDRRNIRYGRLDAGE